MSKVDELTERAEKAREKKAAYGPDIPLESYTSNAPTPASSVVRVVARVVTLTASLAISTVPGPRRVHALMPPTPYARR